MRLKAEQVTAAVNKKLLPVYCVCGDEPLQSGEVADCIRAAAKQQGFTQRDVLVVENDMFNWALLAEQAASLSIFADKKVIDLRIPSGKPGTVGSKALVEYCNAPAQDTVLLISAGKVAPAAQKSRWFQALDQRGAIIQVWPLEGRNLVQWLKQRSQQRNLKISEDALQWLAARVEGNMLAAAQEIEKLAVLDDGRPVDRPQLEALVADHARFDVFKLADALLSGTLNKSTRILAGLKAEGMAEPLVLWAISREARVLFQLKQGMQQKKNLAALYKQQQIWASKQPLYRSALQRLSLPQIETVMQQCAIIDRQIKGQSGGDSWETLFDVVMLFCRPDIDCRQVAGS